MVVIGVVGVLAHSLVHMVLVCGKILDGGLYEIGDRSKVQFWIDQ